MTSTIPLRISPTKNCQKAQLACVFSGTACEKQAVTFTLSGIEIKFDKS